MKYSLLAIIVMVTMSLFAGEKSKTVTLSVSGMTCESCVNTVEKALKKVNGVENVKVALKEKTATVTLASNSKTTAVQLIKTVGDAGFTAQEGAKSPKVSPTTKKSETDGCGDGCCGDECDTDVKPTKTKKTDAKKS
jgi:Cu+-exporting ATPase